MDEIRKAIMEVYEHLQRIELTSKFENCAFMYLSLQQLQNIYDALGKYQMVSKDQLKKENDQNGTESDEQPAES